MSAQPTTTSTLTTRILAIGTINPGVDQAKVLEILPNEVRETVNLYLDGKDRPVVFGAGSPGRGVHSECHRPHGCPRDAGKAAARSGPAHELRPDPAWPASPAWAVAGHDTATSVVAILF